MSEVTSKPYDFLAYQKAKVEKDAAYAKYDAAGAHLSNAQIRMRLAELKSQSEPLAGLMEARCTERERLFAAAFYVVHGRMPEMDEEYEETER